MQAFNRARRPSRERRWKPRWKEILLQRLEENVKSGISSRNQRCDDRWDFYPIIETREETAKHNGHGFFEWTIRERVLCAKLFFVRCCKGIHRTAIVRGTNGASLKLWLSTTRQRLASQKPTSPWSRVLNHL